MIRKLVLALTGAAAAACAPLPVLAQENPAQQEAEQAFAMLGGMFEVEPLTPEQEARLPLAREIVQKVLPEGAMMEVMGSTFDGMLGPITEMANEDTGAALALALGYRPGELGLDEDRTAEVLGIVDPAWRDRNAAMSAATQAMMTDMMAHMEPVMRDVMGELYAIYFTETELADINAFFATESGSSYARQSYAMSGDPRIMAAMFEDPEFLMSAVMEMPAAMERAMADIPQARSYEDLSPRARERLIAITGLSAEQLREGMEIAAETRAAGM